MTFTLQPEGVPRRRVGVTFSRGNPTVPRVRVDGPTDSPHRYPNGELCMWFPFDPVERQWSLEDGAGALATNIAAHLIREEWYRQTGEWPGEEVKHVPADPANDPLRKLE